MRVLALEKEGDFRQELERVGCDPEAFLILQKKLRVIPLKVDSLSCASANILKQIALSLGADCVIHRNVVSGRKKSSSAIILATQRQYEGLIQKLSYQYERLQLLSRELKDYLRVLRKKDWVLKFSHCPYRLNRTYIMGILNVTTDSFYDGGRYIQAEAAINRAESIEEEGADFLDIGAESTRPGSEPIPAKEEIARLKRVLPLIRRRVKIPISCDTYKAEVAKFALDEGCELINDISGLTFDKEMAPLLAKRGAYCVIMHIKGRPKTMQKNPSYKDLMGEIYRYLEERISFAQREGIDKEKIIVDPGIGFGKRLEDNYEIIRRLSELKGLGCPILIGPSRKSFIGLTLNLPPEERLEGTLAASLLAVMNGANILRVHDVKETKRAVRMLEAIMGNANND